MAGLSSALASPHDSNIEFDDTRYFRFQTKPSLQTSFHDDEFIIDIFWEATLPSSSLPEFPSRRRSTFLLLPILQLKTLLSHQKPRRRIRHCWAATPLSRHAKRSRHYQRFAPLSFLSPDMTREDDYICSILINYFPRRQVLRAQPPPRLSHLPLVSSLMTHYDSI